MNEEIKTIDFTHPTAPVPILSVAEAKELEQHEKLIESGLNTFLATAHALAAIQTKKLYRHNYNTFESYLWDRWRISRAHGYRLIAASELQKTLSPLGDKIQLPTTERAVRLLVGLKEPKDQIAVFAKAREAVGEGDLTPKHIQTAMTELGLAKQPKPTHAPAKKTPLHALEELEQAIQANRPKAEVLTLLEALRSLLASKAKPLAPAKPKKLPRTKSKAGPVTQPAQKVGASSGAPARVSPPSAKPGGGKVARADVRDAA